MLGSYSKKSLEGIDALRTEKTKTLIQQAGGKTVGIYTLLGSTDLVLIAKLPDIEAAAKVSLGLSCLTGARFQTAPALDIDTLDALAAEWRVYPHTLVTLRRDVPGFPHALNGAQGTGRRRGGIRWPIAARAHARTT